MSASSSVTDHRRGASLAAAGVLVVSFDALLIRLAIAPVATILFWRGLFMALSLGLVFRLQRGPQCWSELRAGGKAALGVIVTMGLSQVLFVVGVEYTSVANAVVILTAAPLFAALFSGLFLREWLPLRTWVAILACIGGIAIVFGGSVGAGHWVGDAAALMAAASIGASLTQMRHLAGLNRSAVIAGAGVLACALAAPFASPTAMDGTTFLVLAIMGLVQIPLALLLVATATRYLPSAEVSLFLVVEAVLGPLWVWLALGEEPPGWTLIGGTVVIATLAIHSWVSLRQERLELA
ncbi:MAG: DMT family transporter [Halofilum sp. (in: g-proteobacteria)]